MLKDFTYRGFDCHYLGMKEWSVVSPFEIFPTWALGEPRFIKSSIDDLVRETCPRCLGVWNKENLD